jgi:hypothetical protein
MDEQLRANLKANGIQIDNAMKFAEEFTALLQKYNFMSTFNDEDGYGTEFVLTQNTREDIVYKFSLVSITAIGKIEGKSEVKLYEVHLKMHPYDTRMMQP